MTSVIQAVRERGGKDLEVLLQYEDQKDNEWKSVFNHVLGHNVVSDAYGQPVPHPRTGADSGVFVTACGVGFHEQVGIWK